MNKKILLTMILTIFLVSTVFAFDSDYNYFESFESGWGNWSDAYSNGNPYSNTDDWTRNSGGTPSSSTGPSSAYSGSYYIYVETSYGDCYYSGEDAAIFQSPEIEFGGKDGDEISFAYNMYGSEIGTLRLQHNISGSWTSVWSKSGSQGSSWYTYTYDLSGLSGTGNLRFWYDCAGGWHGDTALDAINISVQAPNEDPVINSASFESTEVSQNMDTTFYSNVSDADGNDTIEFVTSTFLYPDATSINVTMNEVATSTSTYTSSDLESGTIQVGTGTSTQNYTDVDSGSYDEAGQINTTIYVSGYSNSGSNSAGNEDPDLGLQIYDGSNWRYGGQFDISSTGNHSISLEERNLSYFKDPSFEQSSLQLPFTGAAQGNVAIDDTTAHTGDQSLKLTSTANDCYTTPYTGSSAPVVELSPVETEITMSSYAKTNVSGSQIQFFIFCLDDSYSYSTYGFGTGTFTDTTTDWQKFTYTHTCPADAPYVSVRFDNDVSTRTAWFDDVELTLDPSYKEFNWGTSGNRDIKIVPINFDDSGGNNDQISYTGLWVDILQENRTSGQYEYKWTDTSSLGTYNVTDIYAYDSSGGTDHNTYSNVYFDVISSAEINEIQCAINSDTNWENCTNLDTGDVLKKIRSNCTSQSTSIDTVNFTLVNVEDSSTKISASNYTSNDGDWYIYDNTDLTIEDSGDWNITSTCIDENSNGESLSETWTVDWGYIEVYLISPYTVGGNTNVTQNEFFDFEAGVRCVGGECGDVEVTLDPFTHEADVTITYPDSSTDTYTMDCTSTICDGTAGKSTCNYTYSRDCSQEGVFKAQTTFTYSGLSCTAPISDGLDDVSPPSGQVQYDCTSDTDCDVDPANTQETTSQINLFTIDYDHNQTDCECKGGTWLEYSSYCGSLGCSGGQCCGDDSNEYFEQTENSGRSCCVDGSVLSSDSDSGSLLCYDGQLYDCNEGTSATDSFETDKTDNDEVGSYRCMSNQTWVLITSGLKAGAVSTTVGDTPFYTTSDNPKTCSGMRAGDECNFTWSVNATGELNSVWKFFTINEPTTYSSHVSSADSGKTDITITKIMPELNSVECAINSDTNWEACSNLETGDVLKKIRANCTTQGATSITTVNYTMINIPDSSTKISASNYTSSSGDLYTYDNTDLTIDDSGDWTLNVTCINNVNNQNSTEIEWFVPWGHLETYLVSPYVADGNTDVTQNDFFAFKTGVRCVGGECGNVEATLDPK